MGNASDSIPSRLARGEPVDVVVLARPALDQLVAEGELVPGSQVDIVRSLIGMAVRKGTPKPDISTVEALKRTLLAAPSIAYSASASGTYYETEMLKKLDLEAQVRPKSKRILSERVGTVVARGEAELGLQQVSELLPRVGIEFIGVLPPAVTVPRVTVFSAGISMTAREPAGSARIDPLLDVAGRGANHHQDWARARNSALKELGKPLCSRRVCGRYEAATDIADAGTVGTGGSPQWS